MVAQAVDRGGRAMVAASTVCADMAVRMPAETVRRAQGLPGVIFGFLGVLAVNLCLAASTDPARLRRRAAPPEPHELRRQPGRHRRLRPAHPRAGRGPAAGRGRQSRGHAAAGVGGRAVPVAAALPDDERGGAQARPARDLPAVLRAAVLVADRDARHALAAHREDDALLAQPLRVEPAEGALAAAHVPAERAAAQPRARQFRRAAARGRARSRRW